MAAQANPRITESLAQLPLFEALDARARKRLAAGASLVEAPRGTRIVGRGDPCEGFYAVLAGNVKLALHNGAAEKVFDLVGRGETFGESAMFSARPYRVSAEALVESRLIHLARDTVYAELQREPVFARAMIERLSRRLNVLIEDIERYTLRTGTERVALYFLQRQPAAAGAQNEIVLPARKRVIASLLNLTQEHFSRILHELAADGVIEVQGSVVRVLDAQRLAGLGPDDAREPDRGSGCLSNVAAAPSTF